MKLAPPRSGCAAPPQGGGACGPAKPVRRACLIYFGGLWPPLRWLDHHG